MRPDFSSPQPRVARIAALALAGLLLAACSHSDGDNGTPAAAATLTPLQALAKESDLATSHGVGLLIGSPGSQQVVQLKPVAEIAAPPTYVPPYFPSASRSAASRASSIHLPYPGYRTQDSPNGSTAGGSSGSGGSGDSASPLLVAPATASAWLLVFGALAECSVGEALGGSQTPANALLANIAPTVPTWKQNGDGTRAFSAFSEAPASCDSLLAMQEALLCAADKLDQVSDSLVPVTWTKASALAAELDLPAGDWTLPVQKTEDKFVTRDLITHLLANIAVLDITPPTGLSTADTTKTCADLYARAATDAKYATSASLALFGVSTGSIPDYFPPAVALSDDSAAKIAQTRLLIETQVLRTTSRILHDTVNAGVQTDVSTALAAQSHASDPVAGGRIAWGTNDMSAAPYGTFSHAQRAQYGRLELGSGTNDRACSGMVSSDQVRKGIGPGISGLTDDVPIVTSGQAAAANLIDVAGMVLPPPAIADGMMTSARASLTEALTRSAATAAGLAPDDSGFRMAGQGAIIKESVDAISDNDLQFAFSRALRGFQAQNGIDDSVVDFSGMYPLECPPKNPANGYPGGACIPPGSTCPSGPSTLTLLPESLTRFASCPEVNGASGSADPSGSYDAAFSSALSLSETLYRRLVVIRENVSNLDPTSALSLTATQGASEARAAFGTRMGIVAATPDPSDATQFAKVHVTLLGFDPSDFATDTASLQGEVILVGGAAWKAGCATGIHATGCQASFEQTDVASATAVTVVSTDDMTALKRQYGTDGLVIDLDYDVSQAPSFARTFANAGSPPSPVYVVLRHDPASPSSQGLLLGTVGLYAGAVQSATFVATKYKPPVSGLAINSPTSPLNPTVPQAPSGGCTTQPQFSCAPGISNTSLIALQNDLTPGADPVETSWKYYLAAAQQAAERADQLGNQWIAEATQVQQAKQDAGQQLAAICGDQAAVSNVQFTNGQITASGGQGTDVGTCLDDDTLDVVFLTDDPTLTQGSMASQTTLNTLLNCNPGSSMSPTAGSNPICPKIANGTVTTGGLGLAPYQTQAAASNGTSCGVAYGASKGFATGEPSQVTDLKGLASNDWAQAAALKNIISVLQVAQDVTDGSSWRLLANGVALMDSSPSSPLFPGCLRQSSTAACAVSADYWNTLFRPESLTLNGQTTKAIPNSAGYGSPTNTVAILANDGDTKLVLWRVEAALYWLASITGTLPGGLFQIAIPAADHTGEDPNDGDPPIDTALGLYVSFYGATVFNTVKDSQGGTHYEISDTPANVAALGPAYPFTADFPPGHDDEIDVPSVMHSYFPLLHDPLHQPTDLPGFYRQVMGSNTSQTATSSVVSLQTSLSAVANSEYVGCNSNGISDNVSKVLQQIRAGASFGPVFDVDRYLATRGSVIQPNVSFSDPTGALGADALAANTSLFLQVPASQFDAFFASEDDDATPSQNIEFFNIAGSGGVGICAVNSASVKMPLSDLLVDHRCGTTLPTESAANIVPYLLAPSAFPPGERTIGFIPGVRHAPTGCLLISEFVRALGLACQVDSGSAAVLDDPPPLLQTLDDVSALEFWVSGQSARTVQQLSVLHLENVPKRVVSDFRNGTVGTGSTGGTHGAAVLQLEQSLQDLVQSWIAISKDLQLLSDEIRIAHVKIQATNLQSQVAMTQAAQAISQLAIQSFQVHSQEAQAVASAVSSISSLFGGPTGFNPGGLFAVGGAAAAAASEAYYGQQELEQIGGLVSLAQQQEMQMEDIDSNEALQALADLQKSTTDLYADLQTQLSNTRSAAAQSLSLGQQIRQTSAQAQYEAAKVATVGDVPAANYVTVDGQEVDLPVNTILRRQTMLSQARYESALVDAKQLACIARLSIEQRIGTRLSAVHEQLGAEAPAQWAGDIANSAGIDFSQFAASTTAGPSSVDCAATSNEDCTDVAALQQEYVGDYVQKLSDFVTLYDVAHPSARLEDVTVLSLAQDLLPGSTPCLTKKPNLILYSGRLNSGSQGNSQMGIPPTGWAPVQCPVDAVGCTHALPGSSLKNGSEGPLPGDKSNGVGVSWLLEQPLLALANGNGGAGGNGSSGSGGSGGGTPGAGGGAGSGGSAGAGGSKPIDPRSVMVTQTLDLQAGAYVLSWWDQSRAENGDLTLTDLSTYRVGVYDASGAALYDHTTTATPSGTSAGQSAWSGRNQVILTITSEQTVTVAFGDVQKKMPLAGHFGSVAIADIQLEQTPPTVPTATPFVSTDNGVLTYISANGCPASAEDVRNAFVHECAPNGTCYYRLKKAFSIHIEPAAPGDLVMAKNSAGVGFRGKFALGNYNFRHETLAVNLVGTNVHACSLTPTSDCYGSGYEQYFLGHRGSNIGLPNWEGPKQSFNFGYGTITLAKALATERYISLPMSASDAGLVAQPEITQVQLAGRPIDGGYDFSIADSPSLNWGQLEDVQFIVKYRAWSAVSQSVPGN